MESLYKRLSEMRERPGMYLGKKSLELLDAYINGYLDHQYELESNFRSDFLDFGPFVRRYFNVEEEFHWLRIIAYHSSSDETAIDLFYELLDKFLIEKQDIEKTK